MITEKYLTTDCESIDISDITNILDKNHEFTLDINNQTIQIKKTPVGKGGSRVWFVCPECIKNTTKLYQHPESSRVACRVCLDLDYSSHRYKGMVEGFWW